MHAIIKEINSKKNAPIKDKGVSLLLCDSALFRTSFFSSHVLHITMGI